jgi:hypothetical protein
MEKVSGVGVVEQMRGYQALSKSVYRRYPELPIRLVYELSLLRDKILQRCLELSIVLMNARENSSLPLERQDNILRITVGQD